MKAEAESLKFQTINGGRTSVLGVLNYNNTGVERDTPHFEARDATLSVVGYREVCFVGGWWKRTVVARQGQSTFVPP